MITKKLRIGNIDPAMDRPNDRCNLQGDGGMRIATNLDTEQAEEIVRRYNNNAALLTLIRELADALETVRQPLYKTAMGVKFTTGDLPNETLDKIVALIARAKEATHGIQSK